MRCTLFLDTGDLSGPAESPDATTPPSGDAQSADVVVTTDAGDAGDAHHIEAPDGSLTFAGNGHAYLFVAKSAAVSWDDAAQTALMLGGHLATVTSAEENAFLWDEVRKRGDMFTSSHHGPWLGGRKLIVLDDPTKGWSWVTGEP